MKNAMWIILPVILIILMFVIRIRRFRDKAERKAFVKYCLLSAVILLLLKGILSYLHQEIQYIDIMRGFLLILGGLGAVLFLSFAIYCFGREDGKISGFGKVWMLAVSDIRISKQTTTGMRFGRRMLYHIIPLGGLFYMVGFFAVTELYFANMEEWIFRYESFVGIALIIFAVSLIAVTLLLSPLIRSREATERAVVAETSLFLGMYLQNLLLNNGGFISGARWVHSYLQIFLNLLFWCAIIAIPLYLRKYSGWKRPIMLGAMGLSGALLLMQLAPLPMMLLTKRAGGAYRPYSEKRLTGTEQFTVSGGKNVIVFIIDAFYNGYFEDYLSEHEEAYDSLRDFTYFDNVSTRACYTTFSIPYILTASDVDFSVSLPESYMESWKGENAEKFYSSMRDLGYDAYLYTDSAVYAGGEGMDGIISNLESVDLQVIPDPVKIYGKMVGLSLYRYLPFFLKDPFFVFDSSEINACCSYLYNGQKIEAVRTDDSFTSADQAALYGVDYYNHDYYRSLCEGLTIDDTGSENRIIYQHIWGMHISRLDLDGKTGVNESREAEICMEIVYRYMEELKKLGLYDSACIIVTADHGERGIHTSDPLVLIKGFEEHGEALRINHAPGCIQSDLLPTIMDLAGEDPGRIRDGESLLRLSETQARTRILRDYGYSPDFPVCPKCGGLGPSIYNYYSEYRFDGRSEEIDPEKDHVYDRPIYDYWW